MKNTLLIAVLFVAACAGTPEKANQCLRRVAASEVAITEGYETTTALLKAEVIDIKTAGTAKQVIDVANGSVDRARTLCTLDEASAFEYLADAAALLKKANEIMGGGA